MMRFVQSARWASGWALVLGAAFGCAEPRLEDASVLAPQPRFSSGYSVGSLKPDASGEPYPVGTPIPAVISSWASEFINLTCEHYGNQCSFTYLATHLGIWNATEQLFGISLDGANAQVARETGSQCLEWDNLPETICTKKRAQNWYQMAVNCGKVVAGTVTHKAWWLGWWDLSGLGVTMPGGRVGEVSKLSTPTTFSTTPCSGGPSEGGGGGGGGGGGSQPECFDVYITWYDPETGIVEFTEYLFTYCLEGNVQ